MCTLLLLNYYVITESQILIKLILVLLVFSGDFKAFVQESHGHLCCNLVLFFRNDEKTANDYKVQGGSVLHLVLALRGGK